MKQPNFLFIGPDKSGSSWIYSIMGQHPDCYVPQCKDIYFFDRHYGRGLDWYFSFFKEAPDTAKALGELSHDYLFSRAAAHRIHGDLPGVKLITCLRNPVERTFSHYLYLIRSGLTRLPFDQALDAFPELMHNSSYDRHIACYMDRFGPDRLKVVWFDHLKKDPTAFAREIFTFLELSTPDHIEYGKKVLPASKPRLFWLARAAKTGANLARTLRLETLVGRLKQSRLKTLLYIPYGKEDKPTLSRESRARLQAEFRPGIQALEDLLNTDLTHWIKE